MGIADRHIEYRDDQRRRKFALGQPGNSLIAIISINIVVFLLILLSRVFHLYTHQGEGLEQLNFDAIEWFALPGDLVTLSERPWTLLTFMFSQGGMEIFPLLITMLSNMLWLYAFGYILQDLSGNRLIFPVYIYGALAGAVFFIIALYSIPVLQPTKGLYYLAGSNTGSMALAIAVSTLAPNYRIFRNIGTGIPVWVLTSIFLLLNLVSAFGNKNPNSFGILGGAIAGFIFVFFLRRGKDGST
jgi:membrane associated rhomboid family serine protease